MSNWLAFSPLDERPFSGRPSLFARARMLKGVTYADSPLARLTLQGSGEHSVKGVDNRTSSPHPPPLPVPLPSHNTVEKKKKILRACLNDLERKKKSLTERSIISSNLEISSKFNFIHRSRAKLNSCVNNHRNSFRIWISWVIRIL